VGYPEGYAHVPERAVIVASRLAECRRDGATEAAVRGDVIDQYDGGYAGRDADIVAGAGRGARRGHRCACSHRDWSEEFVLEWLLRIRERMWDQLPPEARGLQFDDPRDELAWLYGRLRRDDLPEAPPWVRTGQYRRPTRT
jgi:hypothetical protein